MKPVPAYRYLALDAAGRRRRGPLEADTPRAARARLRALGLTPLAIEAIADGAPPAAGGDGGGGRVAPAALALATRQLATLLDAGLGVEHALAGVTAGMPRGRLADVLCAVRARVVEGSTLAAALGAHPRVFPPAYLATVAAGERAGRLGPVCERLADYTEARSALRRQLALAAVYPALLTVVALAVVAGLLTFVVPQVAGVYAGMNRELPWLTRALLAASAALRDWGLPGLAGLGLAAFGAARLLRRPPWRARADRVLLALPLLGRLLRGLDAARCARTVSILLASGVTVLDALEIAAGVVERLPIRAAVQTAAGRVREGASLHRALADTGAFPPLTLALVASGEAGGRLGPLLERAAVEQEREFAAALALLLAVFEPALILAMGGVVLAIVLAILLPIFDLNQLVH